MTATPILKDRPRLITGLKTLAVCVLAASLAAMFPLAGARIQQQEDAAHWQDLATRYLEAEDALDWAAPGSLQLAALRVDANPDTGVTRVASRPLAELRLHQSTVWLWNRPVYDNVDGGHLRIEMRSLPAGPTARDMVANAALLIGLAEGLRPALESLLPALPFNLAEYNFYRAAQHGLNARLIWPTPRQSGYREQPVCAIIRDLLPLAADGLARIGIDAAEAQCYLDVIERRLQRRASGAIWQQQVLSRLRRDRPLQHALHELLELYMMHSARNVPVAEWPV